jgi:hypothetical protein
MTAGQLGCLPSGVRPGGLTERRRLSLRPASTAMALAGRCPQLRASAFLDDEG